MLNDKWFKTLICGEEGITRSHYRSLSPARETFYSLCSQNGSILPILHSSNTLLFHHSKSSIIPTFHSSNSSIVIHSHFPSHWLLMIPSWGRVNRIITE